MVYKQVKEEINHELEKTVSSIISKNIDVYYALFVSILKKNEIYFDEIEDLLLYQSEVVKCLEYEKDVFLQKEEDEQTKIVFKRLISYYLASIYEEMKKRLDPSLDLQKEIAKKKEQEEIKKQLLLIQELKKELLLGQKEIQAMKQKNAADLNIEERKLSKEYKNEISTLKKEQKNLDLALKKEEKQSIELSQIHNLLYSLNQDLVLKDYGLEKLNQSSIVFFSIDNDILDELKNKYQNMICISYASSIPLKKIEKADFILFQYPNINTEVYLKVMEVVYRKSISFDFIVSTTLENIEKEMAMKMA